ncbi:protein ZGRF1 [Colletotrichum spaethianum]|uniref:Protein ZGRF1 n=1 Tax=Colletotrichum spaethianum TaxID=700344 RepID=A0AA37PAU2_9PEZI|nr:protein ZGRF1 [Colletotrichum spaethianum]GKT48819.1 protein ZGRF1 [Colletotrichum spaethianum]
MPLISHDSNNNNNNNSSNQPVFGLPIAAPVLEYICLFTHDLKRKQKRWQDGRLKFHTFNKRIMVYDERGNFIGDMHWREDFDFGEGEEFNLERGAVIVQVAECVGSKDQDLTELLDKRAREVEQRHARSSAAAANSLRPAVRPPNLGNATSPTFSALLAGHREGLSYP